MTRELLQSARPLRGFRIWLSGIPSRRKACSVALAKDYGDYVCPHCCYKALRRSASRCPECHGEPGTAFWERVYNDEAERSRKLKETADRERAESEQWDRQWQPVIAYFVYLFPVLTMVSALAFSGYIKDVRAVDWFWILLPGVNWLFLLGCLVKTEIRSQYQVAALLWVAVGVVLSVLLRAFRGTR